MQAYTQDAWATVTPWCCGRRPLAARAEADAHLAFRDARLSSLDACAKRVKRTVEARGCRRTRRVVGGRTPSNAQDACAGGGAGVGRLLRLVDKIARQIVPEVGQNAIHCAWWENVPVTRDTYEGRSEQGKALSKKKLHRSEVGGEKKILTSYLFFSGLYVSRGTKRDPPPNRLLAKTYLR